MPFQFGGISNFRLVRIPNSNKSIAGACDAVSDIVPRNRPDRLRPVLSILARFQSREENWSAITGNHSSGIWRWWHRAVFGFGSRTDSNLVGLGNERLQEIHRFPQDCCD